MSELINVAEIFGQDVFNDTVMMERLPKKVYRDLKKTIEEGKMTKDLALITSLENVSGISSPIKITFFTLLQKMNCE